MSEWIKLTASDGFELSAWRATPKGTSKGGLVVIQEIFGVNHHIRAVADRFAAAGYLAIAPAMFDRVERGVDIGYDQAARTKGMGIAGKMDREKAMLDIAAAIPGASIAGKVGVVGFCMGGSYAWGAAARLPGLSAAVGYYGGNIIAMKDLAPRIPTMLHFGEKDEHIPVAGVRDVGARHPDVPIYIYAAGHGFSCDERESYDAPSAALAWDRTLAFFAERLG
ncbi:MAG: dienelactone hydrolase family protein [Pseudomonadota bacterium]|nr:dienelactone hydrolase family protein [Pseudomonadota bacterium]